MRIRRALTTALAVPVLGVGVLAAPAWAEPTDPGSPPPPPCTENCDGGNDQPPPPTGPSAPGIQDGAPAWVFRLDAQLTRRIAAPQTGPRADAALGRVQSRLQARF